MNSLFRSAVVAGLCWCALPSFAAHQPTSKSASANHQADIEAATRLQIFLDRANFSPGKLDGHYGEFTRKALALYRESRGEAAPATPSPSEPQKRAKNADRDAAPDTTGLDLATADPVFITYAVTEADLKMVGPLPAGVPEQAKLKSLPYQTVAEAIAEKFHCDVDFLASLNPGKIKAIKAGDSLKVPNVEPFDLAAVKELVPGGEISTGAANDIGDEPTPKNKRPPTSRQKHATESAQKASTAAEAKKDESGPAASTTTVNVDTKTNMVSVQEGGKLIAAYPVTIGSAQTVSPIGDWKVQGVAKNPNFRYDKAMLNHGKRSSDFHLLPPGPNNPVGVVWIALNKKGIGLHGTSDPDSIGRSASHGCVRLANWDIVRLAAKVKTGVPVSIH